MPAPEQATNDSTTFKSGNTCVGAFQDATTLSGRGSYTWAQGGVTYEGTFADNKIVGDGAYNWPDGSQYQGQLVAGLRHGTGTFTGPGGLPRYEGQWKAGRRHGKGKLTYVGGDVYEGDWDNDMRQGQGTLTHTSGNAYVGAWSKGVKEGRGTFHWYDKREQYIGEWKGGKAHGQGEHSWLRKQQEANPFQLRERYVGEWAAGLRSGHGTFYLASGARYVGEWSDNVKHGMGLFSFEDGSLYEGLFEADRMTDGQLRASSELFTYIDLSHLVRSEAVDAASASVRNILIRHNTDIKQVYRFYSALGSVAEDAFNLSLANFRTFAIDAKLVSRSLPVAAIDDLVMRSSASQPAVRPLPRPLVVATALAGSAPSPGEAAEVAATAKYKRGGAHDGERTLLLREFVQGLVEIAAAGLDSQAPAAAEPSPTPPLAQALLEMLESITSINPTPPDAPTDTLDDAAALRVRLQLVYGFYAALEPQARFGKAPGEPVLSVRGIVQMLIDGGLLPSGMILAQLLLNMLPKYYLDQGTPPADAPASDVVMEGTVDLANAPAFAEAPAVAISEEAEEGAADPKAAEEDAPPTTAAPAEEIFSADELAGLMDLKLIYSEFEGCMLAFTRLYAASPLPPWAPPPPPETEVAADEEAPADPPPETDVATEEEAPAEEAAEPEEVEEPVIDVHGALADDVLPKLGAFLLSRLETLGAAAA